MHRHDASGLGNNVLGDCTRVRAMGLICSAHLPDPNVWIDRVVSQQQVSPLVHSLCSYSEWLYSEPKT